MWGVGLKPAHKKVCGNMDSNARGLVKLHKRERKSSSHLLFSQWNKKQVIS